MKTVYKTFSVICMLLALAACVPEQVSKFEFAKKSWSIMAPNHYQFTVRENCGQPACTHLARPVYTVEVKAGEVIKTTNDDRAVSGHTTFKWALTFDEIFDQVEAQVFTHTNKTVEYKEAYGFITSALDFTITDFKNLDGIDIDSGDTPVTPLGKAEKLWKQEKPNSYSFTARDKLCNSMDMCNWPMMTIYMPKYKVTVENDVVLEVVSQTAGSEGTVIPATEYGYFKAAAHMDELFTRAHGDYLKPDTSSFINLTGSLKFDTEYGYIKESAYYTVTSFTAN